MKRSILWIGRLFVLIVYAILLAYAVIVAMAFVLKLLGANPTSDFADWVYRASANITEPFRGIFPTTEVGTKGTSVFDASLLFALLVYLVLAVLLHGLITWLTRQVTEIDRTAETEQARAEALGLTPVATPAPEPVVVPAEPPTTVGWDQPTAGAVSSAWPPEPPAAPPVEPPSTSSSAIP